MEPSQSVVQTDQSRSANLSPTDLEELLPDFVRHLGASNKSELTIKTYIKDAQTLIDFLRSQGMPTEARSVSREHIEALFVDLRKRTSHRTGRKLEPAYIARTYRSVQQLFRWLEEIEEEIDINPFAKTKAPRAPVKPVPVIPEEELQRLLRTVTGKGFEARRDEAVIRIFFDLGVRASELANLTLDDVALSTITGGRNQVRIVGKGGNERILPLGKKTADALSRYIKRERRSHPCAESPQLWLGKQGPLSTNGVSQMLKRRAKDAGIANLYPHRFRHTFAHVWRLQEGDPGDLMYLAGWSSRSMLDRYGESAAAERATLAHDKKRLGDRF